MTPHNYFKYLMSDAWRTRAEAAKARASYRCQLCNSPDRLETHHRTYERLGHELDSDLTVLCAVCHELFSKHGRLVKGKAA
jgi:5-methylcytosine-specific restriction endonuclease McrA